MQEYDDGRLPLYHFDVYRLGDVDEMDEIGYENWLLRRGHLPDRMMEHGVRSCRTSDPDHKLKKIWKRPITENFSKRAVAGDRRKEK